MDFDFNDDQKMIQNEARRFMADRGGCGLVRKVMEEGASFDRELWKEVAELGWLGIRIPEQYGGTGLGQLELCVLAEELGRSVAPLPVSSSCYFATEAILRAGSDTQKERYLPGLASGELIGTFALAEGIGYPDIDALDTQFEGETLSGTKSPVVYGDIADFAIVVCNMQGHGCVLVIVDLDDNGVERERVTTVDSSRSYASIDFRRARATLLGDPAAGSLLVEQVMSSAAVLLAFEQIGGADSCLEMAKAYALERKAFGRPIGSFQAIKQKLADMYVYNELARANAYYGAWAFSSASKELPLAAAAARVSATDAFEYASSENIQTHGGIGYTWEADCHLYSRRSRALAVELGNTNVWKENVTSFLVQQLANGDP